MRLLTLLLASSLLATAPPPRPPPPRPSPARSRRSRRPARSCWASATAPCRSATSTTSSRSSATPSTSASKIIDAVKHRAEHARPQGADHEPRHLVQPHPAHGQRHHRPRMRARPPTTPTARSRSPSPTPTSSPPASFVAKKARPHRRHRRPASGKTVVSVAGTSNIVQLNHLQCQPASSASPCSPPRTSWKPSSWWKPTAPSPSSWTTSILSALIAGSKDPAALRDQRRPLQQARALRHHAPPGRRPSSRPWPTRPPPPSTAAPRSSPSTTSGSCPRCRPSPSTTTSPSAPALKHEFAHPTRQRQPRRLRRADPAIAP